MRTRDIVGVLCVAAALTLSCALAHGAPVNLQAALTLSGERIDYDFLGSVPLCLNPLVTLDGLWAPQRDEAAVALATPTATFAEPFERWLGWEPTGWVQQVQERVSVGWAFWATQEAFPVSGGLYWRVTALEWAF